MNDVEKEQRQARFRGELESLLNKHSKENGSNTPDYIMADYLIKCLHQMDDVINRRSSWYGRHDKPNDELVLNTSKP